MENIRALARGKKFTPEFAFDFYGSGVPADLKREVRRRVIKLGGFTAELTAAS